MNQSTKAALLSGLVFPGVGQISVGHVKRGWFIIAAVCLYLYLIISEIIHKMYSAIAKMQESGTVMDTEAISKMTSGVITFSDNTYLNVVLVLLIVTWVVSVIDAYLLGKKIN